MESVWSSIIFFFFVDKTLLQDPIKWEMAAKTVISVFEDSQKMIRNIMFKNGKLSQSLALLAESQ